MHWDERHALSLEVIVLLIYGIFMCLFGGLLFGIRAGALPFAPDSMYGLFLVLAAFQTVALGRTPFGDLRRSWGLVAVGIGTAILGMVGCFIPGLLGGALQVLVGVLLTGGGAALLWQLATRADQASAWLKGPGILRILTGCAAAVYLLTLLAGLLTLLPGIMTGTHAAILLIIYGLSLLSLAWTLHEIGKTYGAVHIRAKAFRPPPPGGVRNERRLFARDARLPLAVAIVLLQAVLLTLLGALLFPIKIGLLPYSVDGNLGLTLVIMAIQITALGATPLGAYRRSSLMVLLGMLFALLGIFSCIVPGMITVQTGLLLGLLNLVGGVLGLIRDLLSMQHRDPSAAARTAPAVLSILRPLALTLRAVSITQVAFGLSTLLPTLIPATVGAAMVFANGILLFALTGLLLQLDRLGNDAATPAAPAAAPQVPDI